MPGARMRRTLPAAMLALGLVLAPASASAGSTMKLEQLSFDDLAGWSDDDHASAVRVLAGACTELVSSGVGFARPARISGKKSDWIAPCKAIPAATGADARRVLEQVFVPVRLLGSAGHFTGYFEPEVEGSLVRTPVYSVPVLKRPDDLVKLPASASNRLGVQYGRMENGKAQAYYTRQQIEQGMLAGRNLEIAWLKSWEDLFFMQVQGSGRVRLADGSVIRLAYGLKTGLPYTSIGKLLIDRGEMTREQMSMQALRAWLEAHPGQARQLMWQNESYVFFRLLDGGDPSLGPVGAQKLPLTPFRSLAVDRSYWALGVPVWVSTHVFHGGRKQPFNRLMVAQDTGSAIRGPQRGDIFFGSGTAAGNDAGLMDQPGEMVALLPKPLARRLLSRFAE